MYKERVLGFDMGRIVAIFVVIGIYHNFGYAGFHYYTDAATLSLVYSSLGVFTFLSAFLLSSKYNFANKIEIIQFYKKRVIRIWPLFALSSFALYFIHFNDLPSTLKGLIGLSPFWEPAPTTMWYVAMLITLYFLTPFVVQGSVLRQCIKVVLVISLVGIIQIVFKTVVPKTFIYYTIYMIGLLIGRNAFEPTMRFLSSKKVIFITVVWIILFIIVCVTGNNLLKFLSGFVGIVVIMNFCILISNIFCTRHRFVKIITTLSYSTFCAYLFHREVIWLMLRIKTLDSGWPIFLEVLLIGVPLTFVIAYHIQRLYDSFTNRIIK